MIILFLKYPLLDIQSVLIIIMDYITQYNNIVNKGVVEYLKSELKENLKSRYIVFNKVLKIMMYVKFLNNFHLVSVGKFDKYSKNLNGNVREN